MERKQNYSRKREAILKAIRSTTTHPTAEWVYQKVKPEYPDLSLGTVYRNIAQFKKDGTIISVGIVNGQERYDGNVHPHTHFVCSCCGAVIDIPGSFISSNINAEISEKFHLRVDSSEVLFRGICSNCLQRQRPF
ncbi:MAG: transcriptional repressor [Eubacteriales bacterium]|jgi:Fur family transcriptional regulator, peroxide stress response regulator